MSGPTGSSFGDAGDRQALAKLLTAIERGDPGAERSTTTLPVDHSGHIIGITGPPGTGKSTLVSAMTHHLRTAGHQVGVIAVDPSSPLSGGALLGDRVRMTDHAEDDGVFIRSLASRGQLGGLATAVPTAARAMVMHGFGIVLVETVGVGQSEVGIASHADTTLVLSAPGAGDSVQASKAGLLEIADVMVVNKADREGARETFRDLRSMLRMRRNPTGGWVVPVVQTRADVGEGIDELMELVHGHRVAVQATGALAFARAARVEDELRTHAEVRLRAWLEARLSNGADGIVRRVREGLQTPADAAAEILGGLDAQVDNAR